MVVSLIHANRKHEIRYAIVAFLPRRGWVLPERQLLTEGGLLNFENIFAALLQQGLRLRKLAWRWTYFLTPEAQGRLLFDALFGFGPDF
jgi:hypothetical protein